MDKVSRGMSEAGDKAPGCCERSTQENKGITERIKEKAKETADKVRAFFSRNGDKRKSYR